MEKLQVTHNTTTYVQSAAYFVKNLSLTEIKSIVVKVSSHAHTVVWECCKDDQQSMGNAEIWPATTPEPLKRSSPNLARVIMSWVPFTKKKLGSIR